MLCDGCSLTTICKLFAFLEAEELLDSIDLAQCDFLTPAEGTSADGEPATDLEDGVPIPDESGETRDEPRSKAPERAPAKAKLPVEDKYRNLILAYGNLSGVVAATAVVYENNLQDYRIYFSTPTRLQEAAAQIHPGLEQIYLCDLPVNSRNPKAAQKFLNILKRHEFHWFDNHLGWGMFLKQIYPGREQQDFEALGFHCDESAPSTISLISDEELLRAIVGEGGEGEKGVDGEEGEKRKEHTLATLFNQAIQAAPADHSTRYDIVNFLLMYLSKGEQEAKMTREYHRLQEKSDRFKLLRPTQQIVVEKGDIIGSVLVMRKPANRWVNYNELFTQGFKQAPHAIILSEKGSGLECTECGATFRKPSGYGDCPRCHSDQFKPSTAYNTLVGTSTSLDLLELFNLRTGTPNRLTLYGDRLEEALKAINQAWDEMTLSDDDRTKEEGLRTSEEEG